MKRLLYQSDRMVIRGRQTRHWTVLSKTLHWFRRIRQEHN